MNLFYHPRNYCSKYGEKNCLKGTGKNNNILGQKIRKHDIVVGARSLYNNIPSVVQR